MSLKILAIETSERIGSLATLEATDSQTTLVRSVALPADQRSARALVPSLAAILEQCGWKAAELGLICVTTGSGSFTGLRIGVTVAKTLAYATGAPLVGVHTLAAIAAGVNITHDRMWAILDAQRQELFAAQFSPDWQQQGLFQVETQILSINDWLETVRPSDQIVGPPLQKLADRLPAGVHIADAKQWSPRAEVVGRLGLDAFRQGHAIEAMQLVPQYFRKSAAEEKADAAEA